MHSLAKKAPWIFTTWYGLLLMLAAVAIGFYILCRYEFLGIAVSVGYVAWVWDSKIREDIRERNATQKEILIDIVRRLEDVEIIAQSIEREIVRRWGDEISLIYAQVPIRDKIRPDYDYLQTQIKDLME